MIIEFHAWLILPAVLFIAGIVAFALTEDARDYSFDFVRPAIGLACWVAAIAAIGGHYL